MSAWENWSGLEHAVPSRVVYPRDAEAVGVEVRRAVEKRSAVKMVGTGHSFTSISAPVDTMLRPDRMSGIVAVDREALTVTALAGTRLETLNAELDALGLSLHNMGDIAEQTLAGAISTGTHGSGGAVAGLAAQVSALTMVTGTGDLLTVSRTEHPELLDLTRVGLGALGVLITLTFDVEPRFVLQATEQPMTWDEGVGGFMERIAEHHHVDSYWFPHTDRMLAKMNDRLAEDETEPLPRFRRWLDDDFLANTVFGGLTAAANRLPRIIPAMNQVSARALSERTYADHAHRVFVSPRRVVFREMEYAVPLEAGLDALRECRARIDASDWKISFPVEIRTAPADAPTLSTASGRDSFYLAFHTHRDADHRAYFAGMEEIMRAHDGRPHWGKLHSLGADEFSALYPGFADFVALRDRLDPHRVFTNPYLARVLGA